MITLLSGHSLTAADRFPAEKLSVQLSERQSTATLTISDKAPVIGVDNWIQWEDGPGAGIVWRVKTVDEQYDKRTRTITLEHTINALKDRVMFGDTTPADMGGSTECTAEQAAKYILSKSADWRLGGIAFSVSEPYNFNGDDLLSALQTVSTTLEDCLWEYDFTRYPFRLYIRKMDKTVYSEMRTDRNIRTLKKTIDRSRMYTRHYPIGKDNMHISGNYTSKNEDLYGIVCKVETDQTQDTERKLRSWSTHRLRRHCEPTVTVTISGLELVEVTGEPLDAFQIGKMCRVPLPEFKTQILERVTKLNYTDIIADPMNVTVTLANDRQDVANIVNNLQKQVAGGGGGRAAAKKAEEDHAWVIDEQDHVKLLAEAVAGEGAGEDWSRVAEVLVNGNGIFSTVTEMGKDVETQQSSITQLKNQIELKVSQGDIISSINMEPGNIRIKAAKINIDGVIQNLKAVEANVTSLQTVVSKSGAVNASYISTERMSFQGQVITTRQITSQSGTTYRVMCVL